MKGDLVIPNSVDYMGHSVFRACYGFDGKLTLSENLKKIEGATFYGCSGLVGELVIPSKVTIIGETAFYNCRGFSGDLIIPDKVIEIEGNAFEGCEGLSAVYKVPESVKIIGKNAFENIEEDGTQRVATIYAPKDSTGEKYALEYGHNFVEWNDTVEVEDIQLNYIELNLTESADVTLIATITPNNATDQTLTWTSSDETVVTVENGKVTALKAGTATITVTTSNNLTASCIVTVTETVVPTTTITLVAQSNELTIGSTRQIFLNLDNVLQDITANSAFTWSATPEGVVTVSDTGLVTGIGMGTATITCVNKENPTESASLEIAIKIPFDDIETADWQYPYVVAAYEHNLMSGKGEGLFDMNGKLTRAEFVTVLYNYSGKPDTTYQQNFTDVAEKDWFGLPVTWAKQQGVTAGIGDGCFGSYNDITREQLVVMLYQFAESTGEVTGEPTADMSGFADTDEVSSWATEAITWAVQNGILTGKMGDGVNYLDPKGNTTRGECATIMIKYTDLLP